MDLEVNGITLVYNVALNRVWLRDTETRIEVTRTLDHDLKEPEAYRMVEEFWDAVQRGLFDEHLYWEDIEDLGDK